MEVLYSTKTSIYPKQLVILRQNNFGPCSPLAHATVSPGPITNHEPSCHTTDTCHQRDRSNKNFPMSALGQKRTFTIHSIASSAHSFSTDVVRNRILKRFHQTQKRETAVLVASQQQSLLRTTEHQTTGSAAVKAESQHLRVPTVIPVTRFAIGNSLPE